VLALLARCSAKGPQDAAIRSPYPEECKRQVVSTERKYVQQPNYCQ
jgi:hypothetical protein